MMSINDVKKYYSNIIKTEGDTLSSLKKSIFQIGTLRLVIIIIAIIGVYFYWGTTSLVIGISIVSLVVFLALMQYHNKLFRKKSYAEQIVNDAENELKGINYDFSAFDGASEKINPEHSFSYDLDLFGNRSFFQSVNRTVTSFGKETLANIFINPLTNKADIVSRQEAIRELAANIDTLAHFRATAQTRDSDDLNSKDFFKFFNRFEPVLGNKVWKLLVFIVPTLYLLLGILTYMNIVSGTLFIPLYVLTFIISAIPSKKISAILGTFDTKSKVLKTYADLFEIIEDNTGNKHSEELKIIAGLLTTKNVKASKAIDKLQSLHNKLMMSEAYPILLFVNPVLLWNINYGMKVENWVEKYKNDIEQWFTALSLFDSLASLSIFAFNHPDYTYPQPMDQFVFKGSSLGHPLLHRDACVRNDINIFKTPYFLVITGANMAGKSTYLRTIGINHTLACIGAPVCANTLQFYPGKLVTNLRTADSLADNESYFFAELKRLKMIIDQLQDGEELFIILDEILKGTNSEDKQKGSLALIKQLISLKGNGIIATHDLALGSLENEYPDNIKNYRFEADINENHLSFTYKIREGIAQNMNASFLMKQMGITGL